MLPHLLHFVAAFLGVDVDGLNLITDLQGESQAFLGDARPAVERDNDQGFGEIFDAHGAIDGDLACDSIVMVLDGTHRNDQ